MEFDRESTIEYTGERVVPDKQDMNYMLHLAAYEFVSPLVTGLDVLDVGCGTGYGAEVLIDAQARTYVGVDIAPDAVTFARAKYPLSGVSFAQMDALSLGFVSDSYDLVCSFQVIEHLPGVDGYLRDIARVMKQEGTCIISTPNRHFHNPGASLSNGPPANPFHVREYALEELRSLLACYWDSITIWGQLLPVYDTNSIQNVYDKLFSLIPPSAISTWERWRPFSLQVLVWRLIKAKPTTHDSVFLQEGQFSISECRHFFAVCRGPTYGR
jgi:SAM-dependent methyltransferase